MRIYELAQLKNISSKKIIETLQAAGFDVKSHMSVLDDRAVALVEKELNDDVKHHEDHDMQSNENVGVAGQEKIFIDYQKQKKIPLLLVFLLSK